MTQDETYAAMCLWEHVLELDRSKRPDVDWVFDNFGTTSVRHAVTMMAEACNAEWEADQDVNKFDRDFDWVWCPEWFEANAEWHPSLGLTHVRNPAAAPLYMYLGQEA
jgi:hypothetical protein